MHILSQAKQRRGQGKGKRKKAHHTEEKFNSLFQDFQLLDHSHLFSWVLGCFPFLFLFHSFTLSLFNDVCTLFPFPYLVPGHGPCDVLHDIDHGHDYAPGTLCLCFENGAYDCSFPCLDLFHVPLIEIVLCCS